MSETTPPPAGPQNPYPGVQPLTPSDERMWSTLVHVGGIFFNFVPALIGYLVLKDRGAFVRDHTRNALNFQITLLIAYAVGTVTSLILIGLLILATAYVCNIVFSILAAVAANRGELYKYPLTIEFIK